MSQDHTNPAPTAAKTHEAVGGDEAAIKWAETFYRHAPDFTGRDLGIIKSAWAAATAEQTSTPMPRAGDDTKCPRGCTGPDEGRMGCAAVYGDCAAPAVPGGVDTAEQVLAKIAKLHPENYTHNAGAVFMAMEGLRALATHQPVSALTDEQIQEIADSINWQEVEWDYVAQLEFARALLAASPKIAVVELNDDTVLLDAVQKVAHEINYLDLRWFDDVHQFGVREAIRKALTAHSVMVWPEGFQPVEQVIDDKRDIDYRLKNGDVVYSQSWGGGAMPLDVVDTNWALKAVALRLSPNGGIVVWPVAGLSREPFAPLQPINHTGDAK